MAVEWRRTNLLHDNYTIFLRLPHTNFMIFNRTSFLHLNRTNITLRNYTSFASTRSVLAVAI